MTGRTGKILGALLLTFCLSSCADIKEVDDIQIVTAMGIDEGEDGQVCLTAILLHPTSKAVGQEAGGKSISSNVETQCAPTLQETLGGLDQVTARHLVLSHNAVIVFGRKYAEKGVDRALDFIERIRELRRTQVFMVTDSPVHEVLDARVLGEAFPGFGLRRMVEFAAHRSKTVDSVSFKVMRDMMHPSNTANLALITVNDAQAVRPIGAALLKSGKWVASLTHDDTRALLWMTDESREADISMSCSQAQESGQMTVVHLLRTKSTIVPIQRRGVPTFLVRVRARGELTRACPNQRTTPEVIANLKKKTEARMVEDMRRALNTLRLRDVDAAQFGTALFRSNPAAWRSVADHWDSVFPKIDVTFDVQVHLLRTGLLINPVETQFSPDEKQPAQLKVKHAP